MEVVLSVAEEVVEDLVNVAHRQTVQAGLHYAVSGDIARPQISLMVTQTLENVPHLQTALNGLLLAPSGDIVKRAGGQTRALPGAAGEKSQQGELEGRLEEEGEGKCQLKTDHLLPQNVKRNQEEMEEAEAVEEDVVAHVGPVALQEQLRAEIIEREETVEVGVEV